MERSLEEAVSLAEIAVNDVASGNFDSALPSLKEVKGILESRQISTRHISESIRKIEGGSDDAVEILSPLYLLVDQLDAIDSGDEEE